MLGSPFFETQCILCVASNISVSVLDCTTVFQECMFLPVKGKEPKNQLQQMIIGIIYRSPGSMQNNDDELCELLHFIQYNFQVPKLIV